MSHVEADYQHLASMPRLSGLSRACTPQRTKRSHLDARVRSAPDDRGCSSGLPGRAILVGMVLLVCGCTYLHQKEDLMSGGLASREADANAKFEAAKTQNQ